jgi:phospholipase D1/2
MADLSAPTAVGNAVRGASLFRPGHNCMAVARAQRAALLIDAEAYSSAFVQAAERAQRSIIIIGWEFDGRARLKAGAGTRNDAVIGDFLNRLVRQRRRLHIYVLAWDYTLVYGERAETQPLYGVGWHPRRRIHLHYDSTHPGASHHQKLVVIDDALAFCGGVDIATRRPHPDPRVSQAVTMFDGEAADVLAQVAHSRWLLATGEMLRPLDRACDPWPPTIVPDMRDAPVAVSRTQSQSEAMDAVHEVETLYLDMIAAARERIYLETPYFTAQRVAEALAARLTERNGPEVVLVTREATGGWLEADTVRALRARSIERLRNADRHARFEAYCLGLAGDEPGSRGECQSNITLVDDEWLRIGSANLSNRSMALDSECDVTFEGLHEPGTARAIRAFRERLLALHLDTTPECVRAATAETRSLRGAIRALQDRGGALSMLRVAPSDSLAVGIAAHEPEPPVGMDELVEQFAPEAEMPAAGPAWGKIALIALFIGGLAALWRHTPVAQVVTPERALEWAREVGEIGWAPLAVMLAYTPAAFLMFPRPLLTLFAVIAFGSWLGFACALAGISLAALAAYYVGRALPRDTIRTLAGENLNQMSEVLRRRGLIAVLAVRIVPVGPFAVVSMVAGALHIRLRHYVLGTLIGIIPGTLMTTIFVDQLATALEDPARINWGLVAAVVLFVLIMILLVRRWFMRQHRAHQRELTQSA